ncbi:DUF4968 domain-containing protein, partial [bacterium]|nr:DUF4968 domain-containing protein [bacterium]
MEFDVPGLKSSHLRVSVISDSVLRIHFTQKEKFEDTGLNRYGFILESNPEISATPTDTEKAWTIATEKIAFKMDKQKDTFSIFDKKNNKTLLTQSEMQFTDNFSQISFSAKS